jgi:ubiquinol-cytochrome c reductase cytochrome c1 subunit
MKIRPFWIISSVVSVLVIILFILLYRSAEPQKQLLSVDIDLSDKTTLQQGAKLFMNYCSGCHSLRYLRYNHMAMDLGLTTFDGELDKDLLQNNLIFTKATIYSPIEIAMPATDARQWFGVPPPDLSLIARQYGADWLYTYLEGFYEDKTRPFGTNNALVPNVAMPNVLASLVGRVTPLEKPALNESLPIDKLVYMEDGQMTKREFDEAVQAIVSFLVYVGEPQKAEHHLIGVFVILYLVVFLWVVWRLKKNYWKDI